MLERGRRCALVAELLAQDALVQAVAGVEQHLHRDRVVHANFHIADRADFGVVGDGRDRPPLGIEHAGW